jgi:hypothetical protein
MKAILYDVCLLGEAAWRGSLDTIVELAISPMRSTSVAFSNNAWVTVREPTERVSRAAHVIGDRVNVSTQFTTTLMRDLYRSSNPPNPARDEHFFHSSEPIVKSREVAQLGQGSVDREESGIALAPILFALGAFTVAWRYIARARGDLDAYVLSGILVGVFMVARLAFGQALKSRSR